MTPGLDAEIEALVRAGSIAPAATRLLDAYGAELYGFLLQLVGEAEAGELFARLERDLGDQLSAFAFRFSTQVLVYRLARNITASARRAPAGNATDHLRVLRDGLDADDRLLLTLRVDRELAWDDIARVMADADELDVEALARAVARVRERFVALKGELRTKAAELQTTISAAGGRAAPPEPAREAADLAGTQIGSYRIIERLGRGGMGVVWRAEHVTLGRNAVIKFMHEELVTDPVHAKRFLNEAKTAASIRHPGIVEVFDYTTDARGKWYIAMELLEGETLRARLDREHPLTIDLAVAIATQIASAAGAAHAAGVIHRDLKPDNIFLVPDSESPHGVRVKVLDFGVAKLATSADPRLTKTGNFVGTPVYMSPEQCRERAVVDHRTDIYSLGCMLFEMVCGRVPFLDRTVGDLVIAHNSLPPPAPSELAPAVKPGLERSILRSLAKHPDDRFATMADLGKALVQIANSPGTPAMADTLVARPARVSTPPPPPAPLPARRIPNAAVIAIVVAALIAIVVAIVR